MIWIVIGTITIIIGLVLFAVLAQVFGLWLQAYMSRAQITFAGLITIKIRRANLRAIVLAKIRLVKAGFDEVTTAELEAHDRVGGSVLRGTDALIAAKSDNPKLDWKTATALDLPRIRDT